MHTRTLTSLIAALLYTSLSMTAHALPQPQPGGFLGGMFNPIAHIWGNGLKNIAHDATDAVKTFGDGFIDGGLGEAQNLVGDDKD
ncbi:hypothetical protein BKA70DRAFT_1577172 [Coprinopsis sp. MPI-PUGE-AT-0042]|nr:hypothetical protein BKA70DRAFT_1577172 [Coprinopsis sp. MPI-PUGE-AT-0042]